MGSWQLNLSSQVLLLGFFALLLCFSLSLPVSHGVCLSNYVGLFIALCFLFVAGCFLRTFVTFPFASLFGFAPFSLLLTSMLYLSIVLIVLALVKIVLDLHLLQVLPLPILLFPSFQCPLFPILGLQLRMTSFFPWFSSAILILSCFVGPYRMSSSVLALPSFVLYYLWCF